MTDAEIQSLSQTRPGEDPYGGGVPIISPEIHNEAGGGYGWGGKGILCTEPMMGGGGVVESDEGWGGFGSGFGSETVESDGGWGGFGSGYGSETVESDGGWGGFGSGWGRASGQDPVSGGDSAGGLNIATAIGSLFSDLF